MSREMNRRFEEHRRLVRKLGELDVFLTGLRHLAHDAEFATELERIEAIRSMFAGTIKVRAMPTLRPGELRLEFFRVEITPGEAVDENGNHWPATTERKISPPILTTEERHEDHE